MGVARTRQTFKNSKDSPIYVSVEPWPECFELEKGDTLTLIYDAAEEGDALEVTPDDSPVYICMCPRSSNGAPSCAVE